MDDNELMQLAVELAEKGRGRVSPNPMVGAVVVKDGQIVGRGFHREYGGPHAEVFALQEAGDACKSGTLYVTLEPCAHQGQTPPCVDAVLRSGITRVVVATSDPNPKTNGGSIARMQDAGLEVVVGVLEDKAQRQNEAFFKYITTGMPFVILKVAQTLDGRIADLKGRARWITGEESRKFVHELRAQVDAVVIGAGTALADDPELIVRDVEGRNPYRIILARGSTLPATLKLFENNQDRKTILAMPAGRLARCGEPAGATIWELEPYEDGTVNLARLLLRAGREQMSTVLVEGGARVFAAFLRHKFVDRVHIGLAPRILGDGLPGVQGLDVDSLDHAIALLEPEYTQRGEDMWVTGRPVWS